MENVTGAWINTGNSEFFVRNDDFFTNLKLAKAFSADSIVAIDFVDKINVPTMFIAGEKDPTVFPWHTENLYNNAVCKKEYKLFKKTRHAEDLYIDYPQEFIKTCVDWFSA